MGRGKIGKFAYTCASCSIEYFTLGKNVKNIYVAGKNQIDFLGLNAKAASDWFMYRHCHVVYPLKNFLYINKINQDNSSISSGKPKIYLLCCSLDLNINVKVAPMSSNQYSLFPFRFITRN
jgi:hypothetical protein